MTNLTHLVERSFQGDRSSCAAFLELILSTELLIPDREQQQVLSNTVEHPSPFFPFLAFEDEGEVFVPCFESEKQLTEWTGVPLAYRRSTGKRLFELVPHNWWVVFNPGSSIEKPFSPWEIGLLRTGSAEALQEIVSELYDAPSEEFLDSRAVAPEEHPTLFEAFAQFCQATAEIHQGWILEMNLASTDRASTKSDESKELLVGVSIAREHAQQIPKVSQEVRHRLEALLGPVMIGRAPLRVSVHAEDGSELVGSLLASYPPYYTRSSG